ncbi:deoxyuridine 5'-triphosphate nucleotidohydrolase [Lentilactobacillus kosonis]|uniref:Deoxyuridine 5'-triphosphate nucleotidohydrolase n=1 Tax=Lentilactobacillus kosonis TaxID=2810561 RepID=A0A401FJX6_9LACO|nr:deoxyuridine 5'-triphosphate nucleotidohydrolase [Lentilactobacillus kosonis]
MSRGFEIVSKYANEGLNIPHRTTENAAGYDFESATDFTLPSIWKLNFVKLLWAIKHENSLSESEVAKAKATLKPYLVPTGIKSYMNSEEVLIIANRSSNPLKRGLICQTE